MRGWGPRDAAHSTDLSRSPWFYHYVGFQHFGVPKPVFHAVLHYPTRFRCGSGGLGACDTLPLGHAVKIGRPCRRCFPPPEVAA